MALRSKTELQAAFFNRSKSNKVSSKDIPDVVIDPDFGLGAFFIVAGLVIINLNPGNVCSDEYILCPPSLFGGIAGGLHIVIGAFFARQASNIRLVFDKTTFSLRRYSKEYSLRESDENIIVGGTNQWPYTAFVNWDFFPSKTFPILIYFKETKTPAEQWSIGPGQYDKVGKGQVHFLPAIANVRQLDKEFKIRGCAKVEK